MQASASAEVKVKAVERRASEQWKQECLSKASRLSLVFDGDDCVVARGLEPQK